MVLHRARLAYSSIVILAGLFLAAAMAQADTRTDDDYIAIVVEAEDHSVKGDRWILTDPFTPEQENDPDPNHSQDAVGQAYLELLPDMRVTHEDEFGPPTAIWNQPGTGPRAEYPLMFPEAGRYYVHVRAYSTGTEDNGLHVGLNGSFPDSGARLQFCTAGQGWSWSSRQRDSGGVGPCGAKKTIWITVPDAGLHTFMISAREDGFEIDRIMLIKDLSDNTRICAPQGADGIECVNGSLENVDDVVDMAVELERHGSESSEMAFDDSLEFSAVVRNRDGYDTAEDVVLTVNTGTAWQVQSSGTGCTQMEAQISCDLGTVAPSGPEDERLFDFVLMPLQSGELSVGASIATSSVDGNVGNDTASLDLNVTDADSLSKLRALIAETSSAWVSENESSLLFSVTNEGPADAQNVETVLTLPSGVLVTRAPQVCDTSGPVVCSWTQLAVDETASIELGVTPARTGLFSVSLVTDAENLDASAGDLAADSVIVSVTEPDTHPVVAEPDSEESGKASSGGAAGYWFLAVLSLSLFGHLLMTGQVTVLSVQRGFMSARDCTGSSLTRRPVHSCRWYAATGRPTNRQRD